MSSPLSSFSDPSWQVAREYDSCVTSDIESGIKSWDTLANGLETDSIYMAKETVELRNRAKNLLLRIPSLLKEMMKSPLKKVNLRKLAVLRTTPTALQRAAIGKPKTKAKVVFSNTFVLGANLTVM